MLLAACERSLAGVGVTRSNEARVLVACSGGKDSMALVRVAQRLIGTRAVVAHVDHGVHADSSQIREALGQFVEGQGLAFRFRTLAPERHDEATLRDLRYAALRSMQVAAGAVAVLTAHTRDDQAETVLFRFLRARSWSGVRGMATQREDVLRPWLEVPRDEVHGYLAAKGWPSWEDPSNREPRYLRNRLRKELMPLLERRYVAGLSARLAQMASPPALPEVRLRKCPVEHVPAPIDGQTRISADGLAAPVLRWAERLDAFPEAQDAPLCPRVRGRYGFVGVANEAGEVVAVVGLWARADVSVGSATREVWVIEQLG